MINCICKDESCRRIQFNSSANDKKLIKPKFSPNVLPSLCQVTGLVETNAQHRESSHLQNSLSNVYERLIVKCSKKLEKPGTKNIYGLRIAERNSLTQCVYTAIVAECPLNVLN